MTIGRCALVNGPSTFEVSGDQISITVDIESAIAADIDEMKARRQQLNGLVNNYDETVVPFTWSEDPTFDGFYRVLSVSVPSSPAMLNNGFIPDCSIVLKRLTGYGNPWFEVTTQAVLRANAHGVTTPAAIMAAFPQQVGLLPPEWDLRPSLTAAASVSSFGLSSSSGATIVSYRYLVPKAVASFRYIVPPAQFYYAGCTVEILYGSTWYPAMGRNIPRSTRWRISNGLVRLTNASNGGATAGTFEFWNGTVWQSRNIYHPAGGGGVPNAIGLGGANFNPTVTILRNSPEQVTVKISRVDRDNTYTVQRGALQVSCSWTADDPADWQMGIGFAPSHAQASTAFTGGVRATANDANNNRLIFGLAEAVTADTANGAVVPTAATAKGQMWVGIDPLGAGGAAAATARRDEFLGAVSWQQRVVVR